MGRSEQSRPHPRECAIGAMRGEHVMRINELGTVVEPNWPERSNPTLRQCAKPSW